MANEITISANLAYADGNGVQAEIDLDAFQTSSNGKQVSKATQSIDVTETALDLGGIGTVGWLLLRNLDPTNYVEVKTAASGVIFARLPAGGGMCLLLLGTGVTAPVAVAHTAACVVEKLLVAF